MRVRCYMRRIREAQGLSLGDVQTRIGLAPGELSNYERGHSIPRDDRLATLTGVYGPQAGWYPPSVLRALLPDLADCAGCGDELDPDASGGRRYHSDACRTDARTNRRRGVTGRELATVEP